MPGVVIAKHEFEFRFSRSGGHGGQNVNKVSSRAELLFHVGNSAALTAEQKAQIRSKLRSRINADGYLVLASQDSRSQWQNREKAIARLVVLLAHALKKSPHRIATKATKTSGERRLQSKSRVSQKKKLRRVSRDD
jgi:ribosome-associated protein